MCPAVTEPAFLTTVRAGYDTLAEDYAALFHDELAGKPLARAMISAFAELVRGTGGPVADVGCGPGDGTAYLHSLGLDVRGIDLSPGMVAVARRNHPHLRFDEGTMTALDLPDGALGGLVAWYSLIHVPPEQVPAVLAEFHRVLAPGGHLLLAFQVGDEPPLHLSEALGHRIDLDFHRWTTDRIADLLRQAGFAVTARLERESDGTERTPQAHVLARRPTESTAD
ncbi:class I SAM-dependent methyltransferase [Saccharopolyspora hordei]